MPGKNPTDAFYAFQRPLQQDLSCITRDIVVTSPGGRHELDSVHSLSLAGGPILLTAEGLQLDMGLQYEIIKTGETGKMAYRCTTRAYAYTFLNEEDNALYAWHWHPFGNSSYVEPHAHPFSIDPRLLPPRAHFPTGRTSLEEVVRFAIDQLHVEVLRDDWDKVLALNEAKFELHRSWRDPHEAPRPASA
ncbi:MAG TPA: hypothetical protein VFW27_07290 [Actinoplanes sp.]|nr:hypothetical protein [Actinoplanes sp.]